jgi:hypothetical protein
MDPPEYESLRCHFKHLPCLLADMSVLLSGVHLKESFFICNVFQTKLQFLSAAPRAVHYLDTGDMKFFTTGYITFSPDCVNHTLINTRKTVVLKMLTLKNTLVSALRNRIHLIVTLNMDKIMFVMFLKKWPKETIWSWDTFITAYGIFNDAYSNTIKNVELLDYSHQTIWKLCGRERQWLNFRYYSRICMEELRKITQHLEHHSLCPTRDSKQEPLEYMSEEVPFNQPARSGPPRMKYQHNGSNCI